MAHHISEMLADLYAAVEEDRPWSLVRMGDGEVHTLQGVHVPWSYAENRCATLTDAGDLREHSLAAIAEADWVGWHQDRWLSDALESAKLLPAGWTKWYVDTLTGFGRHPTEEEMIAAFGTVPRLIERSQFAWCNLHMGLRRGFVERVLRGPRLFLVGGPMQRWLDEVLRPAGLGGEAVVWTGETTVATMEQAKAIMSAFEASAARVMFASLGVWALPLAGWAKKAGRVGIDWGHLPAHNLRFDEPHWQYRLNTEEEDSPAGTMAHYQHAGSASQCLPEIGYA